MSTEEFSRKTGATLRQLQHWEEVRIIRAERAGRNRSYGADQIPLVRLMVHIRNRKGSRFSVSDLHRVSRHAQQFRFAVFHLDGTLSAFRSSETAWRHLQEMEQPGWLIDVEKATYPLER